MPRAAAGRRALRCRRRLRDDPAGVPVRRDRLDPRVVPRLRAAPFGHRHQMDLHGREGTLHPDSDWDRSSGSTAAARASRRSMSCRSPTGSSTARGAAASTTRTRTRSATTTTWREGSSRRSRGARRPHRTSATGSRPSGRRGSVAERPGATPGDDRGDHRRRRVKRGGDNNREARSQLGGPGGARGGRRRGDADSHSFERIPWRARARDLATGAPRAGRCRNAHPPALARARDGAGCAR